ncbi:ABC transporter substrate-binding protein [Massiliimalia timonensis]|uniref:Sugar ABC transporter substrate-binding protein n=1 Tax=Massiliimalia timonensis TaxID=1987501 RepID=A0A8J6TP84_9FIRM|nr:sugar ABC transporter substrate-binding protein [Massiliimalia timonensis]MBC8609909.1 sugar ABC transporter substrate-binding protein [Massiliimalia timonensis]MBS7176693.1 sugar ABC transporter substrate-binding protein [Clostridiales bacterium]
MKKKILASALCLVMMASLASCGGDKDADTSNKSGDASTGDVSIRWSWWGDTKRHELYNSIADKFEEKNPGIKVEREPNSWNDYWDKLSVQVAGGNAPDMMGMHVQYSSDYAGRGALLDLQPFVDDGTIDVSKVEQSVLDTGKMDGVFCMVPMAVTTASLITNKTLLDEYGIEYPAYNEDWTWDEFAAAGKKFKDATNGEIWFSNDWATGSTNNIRYWARIKGEEAFTPEGDIAWSEGTVAEWLTMWKELRDEGIIPDAATSNEDGTLALEQKIFTTRKCAMHNVPANQLYLYQEQMPDDEIILLRQPIGNDGSQGAIIEGAHWSISPKSSHQKEAAMLINFWTNDEDAVNIYKMDQGVPINNELASKITADLSESDTKCIEFVQSYMEVASAYTPAPIGASEIDTEVKNFGQAVGFGEMTPEQAAKDLTAKAKEITEKNKK